MVYNISLINRTDRTRFSQPQPTNRVEGKSAKPSVDQLFNNRKDVVSLNSNKETLQKNLSAPKTPQVTESLSAAQFEKSSEPKETTKNVINSIDYEKIGRKVKNQRGLSSKALSQYELMPSEFLYSGAPKS